MLAAIVPIDDQCRLPHGAFRNRARDHADLRLFLIDAESDNFLRMREECERFFIIGVDHRDAAA